MALSNVMTEAEAAEKWCPHAVRPMPEEPHYEQPLVANRGGTGMGACSCLGSRCMFWQWHDRGSRYDGLKGVEHAPRGYCGATRGAAVP